MELENKSRSRKKLKQIEIFNRYAKQLDDSTSRVVLDYDGFIQILKDSTSFFHMKGCVKNKTNFNKLSEKDINETKACDNTPSRSMFTDHKYNLNHIPMDTMGLIFFAIDEQNKGYLTMQDWMHFNNLLENNNYQHILFYEFLQKNNSKNSKYLQSITYTNKFLTFDSLFIDLQMLKNLLTDVDDYTTESSNLNSEKASATASSSSSSSSSNTNITNSVTKDDYEISENIPIDWQNLSLMDNYIADENHPQLLTLNSLISMVQNDLKVYKTRYYYNHYKKQDNHSGYSYINRNNLIEILKLQYSHKINNIIFQSIDLSNSHLIKCTNDKIPYNMYQDFIYLFDNFDILNQLLLNYCSKNNIVLDTSLKNYQNRVITKKEFMNILTKNSYNKVNNIIQFSPSQINILFSIVANAKNKELTLLLKEQEMLEQENIEKQILHEKYIKDEFMRNELLETTKREAMELFEQNYKELMEQDSSHNSKPMYTNSKFITYLFDKLLVSPIDRPKNSTAINTHSLNYLNLHDFFKILNPNYLNDLIHLIELKEKTINENKIQSNFFFYPIFDNITNFIIGSVSGIIGATIVYPIDIVKTRMQAQQGNTLYKSYLDCLLKIVKRESFKGLYSGLKPQLIGVAPEKAIKLTVNDSMRSFFTNYKNSNNLLLVEEIISGATAGACQVIFTNPLEIVKIRLQLVNQLIENNQNNKIITSEMKEAITQKLPLQKPKGATAISIVKELGLQGLYKGSLACMARDIPFSAIYFPTYAHVKKFLFNFDPNASSTVSHRKPLLHDHNETGSDSGNNGDNTDNSRLYRNKLKTWELLISGAIAGMPAAYFTTPFDVIKTRLQMDSKTNKNKYTSIFQTAKLIWKEESFKSFFKGGTARVLRSSPQFGFTLAAYEIFQGFLPSSSPPPTPPTVSIPDSPTSTDGNNAHTNIGKPVKQNFQLQRKEPNSSYSDIDIDYYYKSCNIVKTFIDLDPTFRNFDHQVYEKLSSAQRSR